MKYLLYKIKKKLNHIFSKLKYNDLKNKVVIIHTLGKVGSSTLYYELKKISPWNNIFHVHFLSDLWLKDKLKDTNHFEFNNKTAKKVFDYLKQHPNQKKYMISLVREPVSRELSNFMQNPQDFIDGDVLSYSAASLKKAYLDKLSYDYTLNWFDSEFFNYTGFDVFAQPFDKTKGYSIYEHEDYRILIIKLEQLNTCYHDAMKAFLGLDLQLEANANQSSNKPISHVYKELKQLLKFETEELEQLYTHKYVTHFYTDDEIQQFIDKHSK